jgi:glycosyltransferase involved in cell wall biosynthesis
VQIFEITKSPLVSVLLPTYNRIDYLKQSIPSVISQTYRNWELIVVDDGSIDDSICFIRELNDPRIKIFRLRENKGRVVALNFGLSKCQGEYIARLDSDDIFLPRHLEISLCHLEANPTTSLVGSQMFILKDGGLSRTHDPVGEDISDNFLWGNFINNSTAIFVNSIVKEHALRYRNSACEDFDFWVSISNYGKIFNFYLSNAFTANYYRS